jgi:hypothetical protein
MRAMRPGVKPKAGCARFRGRPILAPYISEHPSRHEGENTPARERGLQVLFQNLLLLYLAQQIRSSPRLV